ncbi:MAG: ATP-binding protein [Myxococcota bacterium]
MKVPTASIDQLRAWRERVGQVYLTGISIGIPAIGAVWVVSRWPAPLDSALLVTLASWLGFLLLRRFASGRVQATALVALMLVTGAAASASFGLSAGPSLAMGSAVIVGAAVFGRKVGLGVLAGGVLVLLVMGALAASNGLSHVRLDATDPHRFSNWLRIAIFFTMNFGMLLVAVTGLIDQLEAAWRASEEAARRVRLEHEQRVQADAQRRAAEERANQAQRLEAIGRLAGGVAHDFNNLLVVIMAWADLLPNAKTDAQRKEGIDAIRQASAQAAQLTRQLLSFARREVVRPTAVDLDAVVASALKSLRRLLPDDVSLEHRPSTAGVARALVDEGQLGQVLFNLAANARDAMPSGGALTLSTTVLAPHEAPAEAPSRDASWAALTVADTGVGMDEATRARAFEPFFSTKERGRGTGLGLASVFGVVTQANGWVKVDSAPGRGTRITVAFPLAPVELEAPVLAAAPPSDMPRARVLLAEDDPAVRVAMARALREAGLEVLEAGDVDEALTLARRFSEPIHLLLTDGVMPGTATHVLLDGFKKLFPSAPVLVCSGYVEEELLRRGIAEGAVPVLSKPFTSEALVARVRELLAARPPEGAA